MIHSVQTQVQCSGHGKLLVPQDEWESVFHSGIHMLSNRILYCQPIFVLMFIY
jgi:hypothetical protein